MGLNIDGLYLPCIYLQFYRNHPKILKPFLIFTHAHYMDWECIRSLFYWFSKMCLGLRIIGIASAMHIVGWPKIDLQILYLTGFGLPVRMKVPAHLMVDWVMRSLHLVAIELKSSPEFYRLVISSNVLPFCTCQNVANFICYLEFLPDRDVKTLIQISVWATIKPWYDYCFSNHFFLPLCVCYSFCQVGGNIVEPYLVELTLPWVLTFQYRCKV